MWGEIKKREVQGFALPTVLIASLVMLIVLGSTLSSVVAVTVAGLDTRHYAYYAKTAAQSGIAMAQACLKANNYEATWSNANPLRPNTNCSGTVQGGVSQYLHNETLTRSTFSIPAPTTISNGVQRIAVSSRVERLNVNTSAVWRTYSDSSYATISGQTTFNNVTFGYTSSGGAFFGVVDSLGQVKAAGYNGDGQLGNGTTSSTVTPTAFTLPAGLQASQLYTNFLSVGNNLFAITTDGQVYGAGRNSYGQLGNGSTSATQSTPVRFNLPAGVQARYVTVGLDASYVIGSDNNIYSAGGCGNGVLGSNYTISGCSNRSTYQRVALPTVNGSDLNTLPVATSDWVQSTNLTTDRWNTYARMQGGRVYGWGINDAGQLGTGNNTSSSVPVQITTLGNSGQPTARQVAFDGQALWIRDSNGEVWATGWNGNGQLGTSSSIYTGSGKCIDNPGNATANGTRIQIYDCNNSTAQMLEWAENGSIVFRPNSTTAKCLDNGGNVQTNGNPIQLYDCNGSAAQRWYMNSAGKIVLTGTTKCLDNPGNATANGTQLQLWDCNATAGFPNQTWPLGYRLTPAKVVLPAGQGTVARITTDQWSVLFLMTNGTVWGYGLNSSGQLGNGQTEMYNPSVKKMILPAGRTAVDFYTTKAGPAADLTYANTYVILDDGSVYGAGANSFGQLGTGSTSTYAATPVKMNLPTGVVAKTVQTGYGTTVVLTDEGKIYTVGNNSNGQLGDGTTTNSSTPLARRYVNSRPLVLY